MASQISWLYLSIDRVLILTGGGWVSTDTYLTSVVLVVRSVQLGRWAVAEHIHMRSTVRIVLLSIVGGELIFVLKE